MDFKFLDNKPIIQTKLKVSRPGEEQEKEADRIAQQVMRMRSPTPKTSHLSRQNSNNDDIMITN